MSRWMCCCGDTGNEGVARRGQINTSDNDYLLPSSAKRNSKGVSSVWGSLSRGSKNKGSDKRSTVTHTEVGLDSPSGEYEPPAVPPTQKLPSFEEFRLLKTVGRGAFGKV